MFQLCLIHRAHLVQLCQNRLRLVPTDEIAGIGQSVDIALGRIEVDRSRSECRGEQRCDYSEYKPSFHLGPPANDGTGNSLRHRHPASKPAVSRMPVTESRAKRSHVSLLAMTLSMRRSGTSQTSATST